MVKVIRWTGWTLIGVGVLILLYLVYLLFFTNLQTDAAQDELLEQWELQVGDVQASGPATLPGEDQAETAPAEPANAGDAYAAMWFERDGERIVHEEPLFVVEGVGLDVLKKGPGHYPQTEAPGSPGNFAVAGHRTTYGAPFYHLDRLQGGDQIFVVDRAGNRFVYTVADTQIVSPVATWVLEDDPLDTGTPMLTLTTCHPRFSAAERLIVFAELEDSPAEDAPAEGEEL